MSTKHTPGPWTIGQPSEYGTHNANHIFAGGDGIAHVYGIAMHTTLEEAAKMSRSAEGLANARLLAAAPDLLEALRAVLDCGSAIHEPAYMAGRAAIAKATGEQA